MLKTTNGALSAFFITPDNLWVGLAYLPSGDTLSDILKKPQVNYGIGRNVLKDNNLKVKTPNTPVIINIKCQKDKRSRTTTKPADTPTDSKLQKLLLQHTDPKALKNIKQVLEFKANYSGYEGSVTGFLQPYCLPGYKAYITDSRYPERNGGYIIESTEVHYGVNGARRIAEIGPKIQL